MVSSHTETVAKLEDTHAKQMKELQSTIHTLELSLANSVKTHEQDMSDLQEVREKYTRLREQLDMRETIALERGDVRDKLVHSKELQYIAQLEQKETDLHSTKKALKQAQLDLDAA